VNTDPQALEPLPNDAQHELLDAVAAGPLVLGQLRQAGVWASTVRQCDAEGWVTLQGGGARTRVTITDPGRDALQRCLDAGQG
jgi:hypothetical protein